MKKLNKNLSEIFDIEPVEDTVPVQTMPVVVETTDVVETDANYARENIKTLIDTGNKALNDLAYVANQSESPRAYEVLANMMKNLTEK